MAEAGAQRWLLLIHQIPPKPDYFRVKVRRRLQRIGAAALKNSVYVLPLTESSREDFEWLAREIAADGGEAMVCEATFVSGVSDEELRSMFETELSGEERHGAEVEVEPGRTWVTRANVHVDRMASAWLIRRFIDREAKFRFVVGRSRTVAGELRFDMYDGEYTHEGDRCTFEVLLDRFGLREAGLSRMAEIVHDIDLKDGKYGRAETAGIAMLVDGIVASCSDDAERLERSRAMWDDLYAQLRRRRP
jgi:hypothetical protein